MLIIILEEEDQSMRIFSQFHFVRRVAFVAAAFLAASAANAASGSVGAQAKPSAATQNKSVKDRLYCLEDTATGSRIRRQECRTAAEWKAEGVDVTVFK